MFRLFLLLLALPLTALGQANYATPYSFATLAGQPGTNGYAVGSGNAAQFFFPANVAVDSGGNVYVAGNATRDIRQVTPEGVVTTLAGNWQIPGANDGMGTNARFALPVGVAVDTTGNIYVADQANDNIREVTPVGANWLVTTLAGKAQVSGTNDGTGTSARFNRPNALAVDSATNLYVADTLNFTIRKVTPVGTNWVVTTLAGLANVSGTNDGMGSAAQFNGALGIAVDSGGIIYVADTGSLTIRKITPQGTNCLVTTIAGLAFVAGTNDGMACAARFNSPSGVAVDSAINLYVTDGANNTIRKMTPSGSNWIVTTLAGLGQVQGTNDGTGSAARFNYPWGVTMDSAGNLYVADSSSYTIRRGFPANGAPVILTNGTSLAFSDSLFGFNITAAAGQPVVLDASTDLVNWLSILDE